MRGDRISMIFQQPTSSLNPVYNVGRQIGEVLELHRKMKRGPARDRAGGDAEDGRHPRSRSAGWRRSRTRCRAAWPSA